MYKFITPFSYYFEEHFQLAQEFWQYFLYIGKHLHHGVMVILSISTQAMQAKVSAILSLSVDRAPCDFCRARKHGRFVMSCPKAIFHWPPYPLGGSDETVFHCLSGFCSTHLKGQLQTIKLLYQLNSECALEHQDALQIILDYHLALLVL